MLADAELPDSLGQQVRAAALAVGPDLVACHSTAAALWGLRIKSLGSAFLLWGHLLRLSAPAYMVRNLHRYEAHGSLLCGVVRATRRNFLKIVDRKTGYHYM